MTTGRALSGNDPWALKKVRWISLRDHGLRFSIIVASFFVSVDVRHHTDQLPPLIRESFQFTLLYVPVLSRRRFPWEHGLYFIRGMASVGASLLGPQQQGSCHANRNDQS